MQVSANQNTQTQQPTIHDSYRPKAALGEVFARLSFGLHPQLQAPPGRLGVVLAATEVQAGHAPCICTPIFTSTPDMRPVSTGRGLAADRREFNQPQASDQQRYDVGMSDFGSMFFCAAAATTARRPYTRIDKPPEKLSEAECSSPLPCKENMHSVPLGGSSPETVCKNLPKLM